MHADIVSRRAPRNVAVRCTTDVASIQHSIVIVQKFLTMDKRLLDRLKNNANTVLADPVDRLLDKNLFQYWDGILCCSRKAHAYYSSLPDAPPVFFVEHCADARISQDKRKTDAFAPAYFGAPENLLSYPSLRTLVRIVFTDTRGVPDHDWVRRLAEANFHYALRAPLADEHACKPFLKGITAAHSGANILVHADDGDAAFHLGQDYPYLMRGELREETVLDALATARDDFGGTAWRHGLAIMREVKERSSPESIAAQFWSVVREVSG